MVAMMNSLETYLLIHSLLHKSKRDYIKKIIENNSDNVSHPKHYASSSGDIECIDAIESALGRDQFIGFLRGNIIKYQWRLGKKDCPVQENKKALWYAKKLHDVLEKNYGKN
jgi:hypothetical protein